MTPQEQAAMRQAILDDATLSEPVKRAMLRFWNRLDEIECNCGAVIQGKWTGIHTPDCAVFREPCHGQGATYCSVCGLGANT